MKEMLSILFAQNVAIKEIFYFVNEKLNSKEPHYHICIKKENNILIFSVCTTKIDTIKKYVAFRGYPQETIVKIFQSDSPLPQDCYINCNGYQPITLNEFKEKHLRSEIRVVGVLPNKYYELIVFGLCVSDDIEEDLKELLNKIEI